MEDDARVDVLLQCDKCKEPQWFSCIKKDLDAWCEGKFIQDAMPYLSAAERELLISGTCGSCFAIMFKE